ncbi:MAG TPA: GH92 family glycosyl hydrolase [Acidimicrobiales bacterium]|nr:GH92 family glycosyl hydrolase [Acidimicrobiales bacterium]
MTVRRAGLFVLAVMSALLAPAVPVAAATRSAGGLVADPSALVDPMAGTGSGPTKPGAVGEFPGAVLPFGMVQWSPDTSPDRTSGSGYDVADHRISGFSLTHLSGTGCAAYGDIPVLPTVGSVPASPDTATDSFTHADEAAAPGRYAVTLGPAGIRTQLTVTTRTGLGEFIFPKTASADLLFKVDGSANPVTAAAVTIDGHLGLSGQVTSGQFCGTGTPYTLYFAAVFDRPFTADGVWSASGEQPGATGCRGPTCGAWVSFDAEHDREVLMKVGISFVSVADARANLVAEDRGWSVDHVEAVATASWNRLLGRIRIGGGTVNKERTFYTALYHSLLDPNVVSDADGRYVGPDGKVHEAGHRAYYADFSEWDIYRSEIPLLAVVAPHETADMVQSLVDDALENGWLPKWAIAGGDASQMNGDSADPIIASAYAFGIHDFDVPAALRAMVKGATQDETGHGLEIERQYLDQYLTQHWINAGSLDLTSIDYSIGGSATLEYAIDDFAISRLALAQGDSSLAATMADRSHYWEYLFNPATGYLGARNPDGSFPAGPAFQTAEFEAGGERGFEEGNAVQYTWSVPEDLGDLAALMGGDAQAVDDLNTFFTKLNAGRFAPYDWAGNEPSLWTPWEYDWFGAPWRTQAVVHQIATTFYRDAPDDEPGNDDLGAISSWYVWAALGMYPVIPGMADLALASPLFPRAVVTLPDGRQLVIDAPRAAEGDVYVQSLSVKGAVPPATTGSCGQKVAGHGWTAPWLPASVLHSGATLEFALGRRPQTTWGATPADAPPSEESGLISAVGYTLPGGSVSISPGSPTAVTLGLDRATSGGEVTWTATASSGLTVSPSTGTFAAPAVGRCVTPPREQQALTVTVSATTPQTVSFVLHPSEGPALPPVQLDVNPSS